MADAQKLIKSELQNWAHDASWYMFADYAVAWNAT
jgi:hypothetical protein